MKYYSIFTKDSNWETLGENNAMRLADRSKNKREESVISASLHPPGQCYIPTSSFRQNNASVI